VIRVPSSERNTLRVQSGCEVRDVMTHGATERVTGSLLLQGGIDKTPDQCVRPCTHCQVYASLKDGSGSYFFVRIGSGVNAENVYLPNRPYLSIKGCGNDVTSVSHAHSSTSWHGIVSHSSLPSPVGR